MVLFPSHMFRSAKRDQENAAREDVERCFSYSAAADGKIPDRKTGDAIFLLLIFCPFLLNAQSDDHNRTGKYSSIVKGSDLRIFSQSSALRLWMSPI
jgi:hypothetical protein